MTDPTIVAAREILGELVDELRTAVGGCSADELNRRPAGEDTNGLAVLATHALASTRSWLSLATGAEPPPRDRPAEFRVVVHDTGEFMAWFEATAAESRAILDTDQRWDPAKTGVPTWRYDESDTGEHDPVSSGWALLHALNHLAEHVGHAQLTRQVLAAGG